MFCKFSSNPLKIVQRMFCSAGDIKVFENTPGVTYIDLNSTKCTGKNIPAPFLHGPFADDASTNVLQVTSGCLRKRHHLSK
jgi:hypothetical protein